jgi:NitT/TauT family transport system ATP-binding protein
MPPEHHHGSTLLKVDHVSLALGGRPILRDVSLEIKDVIRPGHVTGQVVALLGPSGMGKTQLFRILAGLNPPDTGSVLVGEQALPVERGMVGVVAQHYPLFHHRRVLGNLVIAGQVAGMSGADATKKANELLARFKLEDAAHKYPLRLSGGQRQRVAIAQQFMAGDRFLLMDEPFSGLDLVQIQNVIALIHEVASLHEHNTIILVTHDISAALEVADTLWLLGRDRDADGNPVPGARVQASYNLIERGLAWTQGIADSPAFLELRREVRARFPSL